MNIHMPLIIKELTDEQKLQFIEQIRKSIGAPAQVIVPELPKAKTDERNIWTKNDEEFLGDAEEALYKALVMPAMENMAELIAALGLSSEEIEKSLSFEYLEYEDSLIKANGANKKVSELMTLSKQKKQDFLKFIQGASDWTKKKLKEIERILSQKLPDPDKLAEEYAVRAAFIAKIRSAADTEALEMTGAFVDRFPSTIDTAKHEKVVVSQRQKDSVLPKSKPVPPPDLKLEAKTQEFVSTVVTAEELEEARKHWKKLEVLPLQPQEIRAVENAQMRTSEKISEVRDKHRAGIKQIVLQAINGRWSSQQLAQALFDNFGDQNRDWRRVAITELAMATNDAYIAGCVDGDVVTVPAVEGSCKYCKKYLENKSFIVTTDPKLMGNTYEQEMKYIWVGKTNYGRNVAAWIPCIPLHPNCRHRFHKLSRFYKMVDGKAVLKTTTELIQEERARRGLPPDPNL